MSDAPLPTGHPQRHGYVQCARCGTWRLPIHTNTVTAEDAVVRHCSDTRFCSEVAKLTGRLEGV